MDDNKRNNLLFFSRRSKNDDAIESESFEPTDRWFDGTGALSSPPMSPTGTFLRVLTGGMSEKIVSLEILRSRRERLVPKLSLLVTGAEVKV